MSETATHQEKFTKYYKYECLGMWDCGMTNHSEAATQYKLPI